MSNKDLIIFSLFFLVFSLKFNYAQDTIVQKFSLKEAQAYASKNNYTIKNAIKDINIARGKIRETTAIGLPQVSGSVSYNNMLDIPTMMLPDFLTPSIIGTNVRYGVLPSSYLDSISYGAAIPVQFGTQHNASFSASISQLVFNGEYIVGLQAAKIFLELSQKSLTKSEMDIKEMVAQSYFLVLVAEENKKILKINYENLKKTLSETKEMYNEGFVEETDVDQLQLTTTNLKNILASVERQTKVAYRLLKFQMGLDLSQKIELTENLEDILNQANIQLLFVQEFDINGHIDYQLLKTQEGLSILNLKRQKSAYLPSMAAFFSYQKSALRREFDFFESGKDWYPTTILGFQLEVPIFSSGMKHFKVRQATEELDKIRNTKLQVEQGLLLEVEQARNDFSTAQEKYFNEKENMELSKKIYDKTLLKYQEGVSSSYELTQTQSQYVNTQSNYFNSIFEFLNARSKLEKILTKN